MTTSSTQIGYLDLAAFYESARGLRSFTHCSSHVMGKPVADICDKLMCVIDAIRVDGLDPRWNPERDAVIGMNVRATIPGNPELCNTAYVSINRDGADDLVAHLHSRGYKIVKDDNPYR